MTTSVTTSCKGDDASVILCWQLRHDTAKDGNGPADVCAAEADVACQVQRPISSAGDCGTALTSDNSPSRPRQTARALFRLDQIEAFSTLVAIFPPFPSRSRWRRR